MKETSDPSPVSGARRLRKTPALLVSFSGIDGAGKTTQIEAMSAWLKDAGFSVQLIRFWDDIAALRPIREFLGHSLFKGEKGVGAPGKPVQRKDKNVRTWYMTPVRMGLCLLDTVRLICAVNEIRRRESDVVIFDRYIYDQFANLDIENFTVLSFLRFILRLVPRPDLAFLLDADPELAQERKPEYPLVFQRMNRASYLALRALAGMTLIPPGTPGEVGHVIRWEVAKEMRVVQDAHFPAVLTSTSD